MNEIDTMNMKTQTQPKTISEIINLLTSYRWDYYRSVRRTAGSNSFTELWFKRDRHYLRLVIDAHGNRKYRFTHPESEQAPSNFMHRSTHANHDGRWYSRWDNRHITS